DGIDMPVRHAENVIGLVDQFGRQHPAALLGDVDTQFVQRLPCIRAWRLAVDGADARRENGKITACPDRMTEKPVRHRTATNVSRADKKNGFHSGDNLFNLGCAGEMSTAKSA